MILDDIKKEIRNQAIQDCIEVIKAYQEDCGGLTATDNIRGLCTTVLIQRLENIYERD